MILNPKEWHKSATSWFNIIHVYLLNLEFFKKHSNIITWTSPQLLLPFFGTKVSYSAVQTLSELCL